MRTVGLFFLFGGSLFVAACSEPATTPSGEPSEAAPAPAPEPVTSGVLHTDGIPAEGIVEAELIAVSRIPAEARERLERQRELFEYSLTGVPEGVRVANEFGVTAGAYRSLRESLAALKAEMPTPLVVNKDLGNNRLRKYPSDREAYEDYKYLVESITLENLQRAVKFISDKYAKDLEALSGALADEDEARAGAARVTLKWFNQLGEFMNRFPEIATRITEARRNYEERYGGTPRDWAGYASAFADQLLVDAVRYSTGSTPVDPDGGAFELPGQGTLILRVVYDEGTAYFILTEDEERVTVEDRREWTKTREQA